ncbi:MAG: response regulator [Candidatus Zambryskibacteria bacterium]|nr:response regulator [Candidatus Zambryskibacteria bacterium]
MTEDSSQIKILLVDDDRFLLDMYSVKFQKSGLHVDVAPGSSIALQKLREGYKADIILLDIIMPTMDGIALLEIMRAEKLAAEATVVMLTNQADDEEKAEKFGIDGFIVKAMTIPSEVVAKVLDIHKKRKKI